MIRATTHKLVWWTHGVSELYDLVEDPCELRNVFDQPACAEVQRHLKRRLLGWQVLTADAVPFEPDPRGFPPALVT